MSDLSDWQRCVLPDLLAQARAEGRTEAYRAVETELAAARARAAELEHLETIVGITEDDVARYGDRTDIIVAVEYWINSKRQGDTTAEEISQATIAAMVNLGWRAPDPADRALSGADHDG